MSKLSNQDVKHVAKLAKLDLSGSEVGKFSKQLSEVVDFVDELNEVDTSKTSPTNQTTGLINVKREDVRESTTELQQEEAVSGTDSTQAGYFKVKAIFEPKDE